MSDGLTVRLNKDTIDLAPEAYAWTQHKRLDGVLKRGDLVYLRLSALLCAADRIWVSGTKR